MEDSLKNDIENLKEFIGRLENELREIWPDYIKYKDEPWFYGISEKFKRLNEEVEMMKNLVNGIKI